MTDGSGRVPMINIAGQWIGLFSGPISGTVVLNLDKRPGGFSGAAIAISANMDLPSEQYRVTLYEADSRAKLKGHADLYSYAFRHHGARAFALPHEISKYYPEYTGDPVRLVLEGEFQSNELVIRYTLPDSRIGEIKVFRDTPSCKSLVPSTSVSWKEFKERVSADIGTLKVYRGQCSTWPLRTTFHRSERFDTTRFASEDYPRLEAAITSATDTSFNGDSRMMVALLGIAQHHGFPTPLLDWTASPYVAAYFACRDSIRASTARPTVFEFDRDTWAHKGQLLSDIGEIEPGIHFLSPLPLKNPRLIPQQSLLMFCNVDNLERYVLDFEKRDGKKYLSAFSIEDSPMLVLRDLRKMGVYAGSLFPGLDGMCRGVFEETLEL